MAVEKVADKHQTKMYKKPYLFIQVPVLGKFRDLIVMMILDSALLCMLQL